MILNFVDSLFSYIRSLSLSAIIIDLIFLILLNVVLFSTIFKYISFLRNNDKNSSDKK